jgi:hypothetical protein
VREKERDLDRLEMIEMIVLKESQNVLTKGNHVSKESATGHHHPRKVEKSELIEEKILPKDTEEKPQIAAKAVEGNGEAVAPKDGKPPFKRNKYRNRFRRHGNRNKKPQQGGGETQGGDNSGNALPKETN